MGFCFLFVLVFSFVCLFGLFSATSCASSASFPNDISRYLFGTASGLRCPLCHEDKEDVVVVEGGGGGILIAIS